MNVLLKILCGDDHVGEETRVPLPKCLIGRNPECHLRFQHPAVSRRHCVVYAREGRVFVRDLDSRNGTLLNGHLVWDDHELRTGDELQLGPLVLEVRILLDLSADERVVGGEASPAEYELPVVLTQTVRGVDKDSISAWLASAGEQDPPAAACDSQTRLVR